MSALRPARYDPLKPADNSPTANITFATQESRGTQPRFCAIFQEERRSELNSSVFLTATKGFYRSGLDYLTSISFFVAEYPFACKR